MGRREKAKGGLAAADMLGELWGFPRAGTQRWN